MTININDEFKSYTLVEVAALTRTSVKTIRNHLSARKEPWASLPRVKIGGKILIPHAGLVKWMADLGLGPEAEARPPAPALKSRRRQPPRTS